MTDDIAAPDDNGNGDNGVEVGDPPPTLPAKPPEHIRELFAWFQQGGPFGVPSEIGKKVTGEHVTQIIQNQDEESKRVFADRRETRVHHRMVWGGLAVFILALVGILIYSGNESLTTEIIRMLIVAGSVGFGGVGWGMWRVKSRE